jgi:hypothetical protein
MIDRLSNSLKNKGRAAHNSTYKKLAAMCSADSFVVNQSLVLRINICGKNRQLLIAAKRYLQPYETKNMSAT